MSHELEQLKDGSTAFVTARVPAWHRLGQVADKPMTAAEMLELSHLGGWNVRKSYAAAGVYPTGKCFECRRVTGKLHTQKCPVPDQFTPKGQPGRDRKVIELDTMTVAEVPGWHSIIRDNPVTGDVDQLGMVGPDYTPVQNEELADFLSAVTDQSGAIFETAGSLRDGQDVFMTVKLPKGIKVGGVDDIDLYLAGLNSHTGRKRLQVITTPVRVVCANTERAALETTRSRYTFRHTPGIMGRITEAQEALKLTFEWTEVFKAEAEAMINTKLPTDEFTSLVKAVWPEKFSKKFDDLRKQEVEHFDTLQSLFLSADTQENIRGTVWAGYQAIVEYLDWQIPVTGQTDQSEVNTIRATRNFSGMYDPLKLATFEHCRNLVAAG